MPSTSAVLRVCSQEDEGSHFDTLSSDTTDNIQVGGVQYVCSAVLASSPVRGGHHTPAWLGHSAVQCIAAAPSCGEGGCGWISDKALLLAMLYFLSGWEGLSVEA